MSLPTLTNDQRTVARDKAIRARRIRSDFKVQLRSGSLSLPGLFTLLADPAVDPERAEAVARLRIDEVLLCLPGFGESRADAALVAARLSGNRRLRGIGIRQKEALLDFMSAPVDQHLDAVQLA